MSKYEEYELLKAQLKREYEEYELLKAQLKRECKTRKEYEKRLQALLKKLKI